jgi:hypothetical protein
LAALALLPGFSMRAVAAPPSVSPLQKARIAETYGTLPLRFEANAGQAEESVKFLSRGKGYVLQLTRHEASLLLCKSGSGPNPPSAPHKMNPARESAVCDVVRLQLSGAGGRLEPVGEEELPGTVNYFIGSDPAKWCVNVPTYAKVRYPGVYPGIDLVYYGNQQQLEFDFVVAPNADPRHIRLRFGGADHLHLAANGDAVVTTANGNLVFRKPLAYQLVDGQRHPVAGNFALLGKQTVGFLLASYDRSRALVIDPVLAYSTFLGGSGCPGITGPYFGDKGDAIVVDAAGNAYVAGATYSINFPVTPGALQTSNNGAAKQSSNAFVAKLNSTGTALVYSTYLGGSGNSQGLGDAAYGLAVDSSGNAYVTGSTMSTDFPATQGAFQTTNHAAANESNNAFITKLNATGTALVYSTYLGGSGTVVLSPADQGNAVAVDAAGDAYVAGRTHSTDFPVTPGTFQATNHAASGDANAFVAKLNSTGTALVYSTYLGGSGGNATGIPGDVANAIAVDAAGEAYVVGQAGSAGFPVTPGAYQTTNEAVTNKATNAFVTELNPTGSTLVYSTYLGGSGGDSGNAIAVDAAGEAYVVGQAGSADFPVTPGAFQTTNLFSNAFITKLNATGTALVYSTYLGGSGGLVNFSPTLLQSAGDQANGLAVDSSGNVYVAGSTASSNFPVTQDAYQSSNNDQPPCGAGCIGGYNAFITELNSTGSALVYSTYLGGNGLNAEDTVFFGPGDQANALALDSSGNVYVTGSALSTDFPVISGAFQTTIRSGENAFVTKLNMAESSSAATPTVTVTPASSTITSAQPLSVTISVAGPSGTAMPTGTVILASGSYVSAPATLSNGDATIDIPGGLLGADPGPGCGYRPSPDILSVNYLPDEASSPAYKFSSGLGSIEVASPCLSVSPNSSSITWAQSQSQPFPLVIAAPTGAGNPIVTGTVTVTTGSYNSGALVLSGGTVNASIPAGTFVGGSNSVSVSYSGDSNYTPLPSLSLGLVDVTGGPGFGITGTAVTVKAGATSGNTSTITVTPTGGFTGSVTLTPVISLGPAGAQDPPTFSFGSTNPVNITGSGAGTATLAVNTTAPSSGCSQAREVNRELPWYAGGGATLACVVFFGILVRQRRWWTLLGMLALLIIVTGGLLACGGGGGSTCNGTTPGTYTITVTGTSGTTTASGTVTLTVQ